MQWNDAPEVPTRGTTVRPNALRDASRPDGPTLTMKADATAGTRHDGHASFAELRHGEWLIERRRRINPRARDYRPDPCYEAGPCPT